MPSYVITYWYRRLDWVQRRLNFEVEGLPRADERMWIEVENIRCAGG